MHTSPQFSNATRQRIADRHSWVCQVCFMVIPHTITWAPRDPLALTLDHIIPQSHGGTHDDTNLRPTHSVCNTARRNSYTWRPTLEHLRKVWGLLDERLNSYGLTLRGVD